MSIVEKLKLKRKKENPSNYTLTALFLQGELDELRHFTSLDMTSIFQGGIYVCLSYLDSHRIDGIPVGMLIKRESEEVMREAMGRNRLGSLSVKTAEKDYHIILAMANKDMDTHIDPDSIATGILSIAIRFSRNEFNPLAVVSSKGNRSKFFNKLVADLQRKPL